MQKLNATALGLALGILWAVGLALLVLLSLYANWGNQWVELIGSVYWGVDVSLMGALIALPWAFLDAFIGGFLVAWLYNKLS
jgi:hypothetical protein